MVEGLQHSVIDHNVIVSNKLTLVNVKWIKLSYYYYYYKVSVRDGDETVSFRIARLARHDVEVGLLVSEWDGGHDVSAEVDTQDRDCAKRQRNANEHVQQERRHLGDVACERVRDRLAQVVEDAPSCRPHRHDTNINRKNTY